MFIEEMIVLLS